MKRFSKLVLVVASFITMTVPAWGQTPSTEGQDFWVTFLRADSYDKDDKSATMSLHISSRYDCSVTISNHSINKNETISVKANQISDYQLYQGTVKEDKNPSQYDKWQCYSYQSEQVLSTAIHVTSTAPISLFASNYKDKSFDATNVLPTTALLDDYLVQTYPPSDHEDKPQGSHFAIIAVEDGETTIDYNLTATTKGGKSGAQNVKLKKGEVWYVWTGQKAGEAADFSGTKVKAQNGKKIAVFQGCPHTNIPDHVRDRDHIFSQAMPTAYWGTEFAITASRKHRRDIVAVMAINDGTQVYINAPDGGKQLVHTFDFTSSDPEKSKPYWTFEIGEELAYCADKEGESPSHGKLPYPLVIDSSCYLTTSCPAGVHLFMVSNRYDNAVEKVSSDTLVSDPAMLWISPIEQVIKEINFATFKTDQAKFHFMNIITPTVNVDSMKWNGSPIAQHFHPLMGNPDYSYARIEINHGSHNLKGHLGFLAHVYGYGERESYAYSCGSSTIQRSISFNGIPLTIDTVYPDKFCVNEPIEMKLNIGNNDYTKIVWDFGDGVKDDKSKKDTISHTYTNPGWYDLTVSAEYTNPCTNKTYNEDMTVTFLVWKADTVFGGIKDPKVITLEEYKSATQAQKDSLDNLVANSATDTLWEERTHCYDTVKVVYQPYCLETEEILDTIVGQDSAVGYNDSTYYQSTDVVDTLTNDNNCPHYRRYYVKVKTCLNVTIEKNSEICQGQNLDIEYDKSRGDIRNPVLFVIPGVMDTTKFNITSSHGTISLPTSSITKPGYYHGSLIVKDDNDCTPNPKVFPIDFAVNYSESLVDLKFSNVLAVRKDNDYHFTHYQWYINDKPVGGDVSVLYLGENVALDNTDVIYVTLTDQNGMVLKSCPQNFKKNQNIQSNKAPVRKVLQNQHIYILRDEQVFDIFGQKVK